MNIAICLPSRRWISTIPLFVVANIPILTMIWWKIVYIEFMRFHFTWNCFPFAVNNSFSPSLGGWVEARALTEQLDYQFKCRNMSGQCWEIWKSPRRIPNSNGQMLHRCAARHRSECPHSFQTHHQQSGVALHTSDWWSGRRRMSPEQSAEKDNPEG